VLPGVYATPELARTWQTRARALALHHRDAVLIGAAAARVSFWPTAPLIHVQAAIRGALKPQAGFSFCRRRIPEELIAVRGGLRYTVPALTAIDLATFECSDAIDIAPRVRAATLAGMYEALRMTPHRAGNLEKLKLLIDSRNEPWSAAERLSHRLLRAGHITGWETNLPVYIDGQVYYLDIAFKRQKLAIEIDGRRHETDVDLFESDRWRQNALVVADGWRVLRFTWAMLRNHPGPSLAPLSARSTETHHGCAPGARFLRLGARERCGIRVIQSSSAPAPSGSISSMLRPVSAASCSTIVRKTSIRRPRRVTARCSSGRR
jgi:very-short-patch-repair endonuclease